MSNQYHRTDQKPVDKDLKLTALVDDGQFDARDAALWGPVPLNLGRVACEEAMALGASTADGGSWLTTN